MTSNENEKEVDYELIAHKFLENSSLKKALYFDLLRQVWWVITIIVVVLGFLGYNSFYSIAERSVSEYISANGDEFVSEFRRLSKI